jgi:hypothetical protein
MKNFAVASVFALGLLSATPAMAASNETCSLQTIILAGIPVGKYVCTLLDDITGSSGGAPVGAPAPLLASGIPSMIALGAAAFALRRRNQHNDAEDEQITEAGS